MGQESRIPKLPPEISAYIAGLIDGEGTVTLTRMHANETRRLVVSIANTELQILQFVIDQVHAGKITNKSTTSDRHTPSFCYAITSQQALELLRQVTPYMLSCKRQRAELALVQYNALTPRNGKYTPELLAERHEFEQSFLNLKSVREAAGTYHLCEMPSRDTERISDARFQLRQCSGSKKKPGHSTLFLLGHR